MPHSFGYRARTRDLFSKAYKTKGRPMLGRYLVNFHVGDYVDIKADPSVQSGMPHKFYHGRTGIVFNVTKSAVGVEVTKVVGNRQLRKRIHVRVEHVRKSRCNELFLKRVKENDALQAAAKKTGETVCVRRIPPGPRPGKMIKADQSAVKVLAPIKYVFVPESEK
uniref:Ribosomal protein L21 n=1 Tax=Oxyrrhis marina TaxID=2969 RepID=A7WQH6_OXYMA|nr:ribosomal protein L21 [Oxyrrhis marina]